MPDHARSDDGAVQAQLDRLWALSPGADVLGLERITALLARLGNPERQLPPVFHVAGTNGKGSTCAFLRAALEAAGHCVHVYTSPHLVRFNERIRLAGRLIEDDALAALLAEVLDAAGDELGASFFEVTTAAAFLAFARTPAEACVIEVGLGGRLDATNVLPAPVACGIAQLGLDHQAFLGDTLEAIAREKAGIAKPSVPLLTMRYPPAIAAQVGRIAAEAGATWLPRDLEWQATAADGLLRYRDRDGALGLPLPRLAGTHQTDNAALAIAMLRHQAVLPVAAEPLARAMTEARWPARLQRLERGALVERLPPTAELWLDGGHNPAAAAEIARFIAGRCGGRALAIILGMLANKDLPGFLAPFAGTGARLHAVPVPGHEHHDAVAIAAAGRAEGLATTAAGSVAEALDAIAREGSDPVVLIGGSLYLAGEALRANGSPPE